MKKNWLISEARKTDGSKDYAIMENPETRSYLDDLLLNRFWPFVWSNLESSTCNYFPQDTPVTEFELGHILTRSLTFMLLDEDRAFFRGTLSCSKEDWMLKNEFFLSLSKDNDPRVIFEILGNSRFRGNPPELSIDKMAGHFYQITLHAGNGAGWGIYDEDAVEKKLVW
ncbi:MAG: hypothetical protein AB1442_00670 [Nitrospirota bacterium]